MKKIIFTFFNILIFTSCIVSCTHHPDVPENTVAEDRMPKIFPDYTEVTIPANIAPMNFAVREQGSECVARLTAGDISQTYGDDMKVIFDIDEWRDMLTAAKGDKIQVELFVRNGEEWKAYKPFCMYVAEDDIDEYISYRLIKPSYVAYELLTMNQRNLTNFDESDIYNNMIVSTEAVGQCINCHSYRNFKTDNMQFHMRQGLGGTMIVHNGDVKKIDLKTDSTLSAGVYPAWHPTEDVIAYSTNKTGQSFHTKSKAKIEVQDTQSDLILYDVTTDEVMHISCLKNELEVFPTWDATGDWLYFCSAHFECREKPDSVPVETEMISRYTELKYNLYRKSFDKKTHLFGPTELVYDAAAINRSVTLPRISPDNRYMLFAEGDFGCFHVWHPEADIMIMDMKTLDVTPLKELNSRMSESYPTWSSTGRWVMTASRRDDGNYTRPYIAYFDRQGHCHKPFEVPQRDPNFYIFQGKSYNRPEFMIEPVKVTPQQFAQVAKQDALKCTFKSTGVSAEIDSTGVSAEIDGATGASTKQKD